MELEKTFDALFKMFSPAPEAAGKEMWITLFDIFFGKNKIRNVVSGNQRFQKRETDELPLTVRFLFL